MSKGIIYLDYAAATPVNTAALKAASSYFSENYYNPSATYQAARGVRQSLESARAAVAKVLGAKDQEIIFTAGGSEANNIAISSIMSQYPTANIVVSAIEHESVLEPAQQYDYRIAPVDKNGVVDIAKLESLIDENTALVSVMYANNEIGTIQPLKEVANIIENKKAARSSTLPLYLHTDACQAANYLDLQVARLGVDMMTLNGGKIYALKQSGCLYINRNVNPKPFTLGGGQERGIRSGTENVIANIIFATMLQKVQSTRKSETKRLEQMRNELFTKLSQNINVEINGDKKMRLPNNLNILLEHQDGERLVMELDELGVLLATGSACTASSDKPSHVLLAIGLSEKEASSSLRVTLGRQTTSQEIETAADSIIQVVRSGRALV